MDFGQEFEPIYFIAIPSLNTTVHSDSVLLQMGRNAFHLAAMKGHVDAVNTIITFNKSSAIIVQADKVSKNYVSSYITYKQL